MKKAVTVLMIAFTAIGLGLLIWGDVVMMNYENYREIMKAAFREARPQFVWGIILFSIAYVLTYVRAFIKK